MAYTYTQYQKINWTNETTPLNANNLNHMDQGIADASIDPAVITLAESLGWVNPEEE